MSFIVKPSGERAWVRPRTPGGRTAAPSAHDPQLRRRPPRDGRSEQRARPEAPARGYAMRLIAPSILSADFARLGEEGGSDVIARRAPTGSTLMSWTITSSRTSPSAARWRRRIRPRPAQGGRVPLLDVHLMVQPVDALVESFAAAGANLISFHPDASTASSIARCRLISDGRLSGRACRSTRRRRLDVLEYVDRQGRPHPRHEREPRLRRARASSTRRSPRSSGARRRIDASGRDIRLEVDGGIKVREHPAASPTPRAPIPSLPAARSSAAPTTGGDRRHALRAAWCKPGQARSPE